jgi:hypothetical protein
MRLANNSVIAARKLLEEPLTGIPKSDFAADGIDNPASRASNYQGTLAQAVAGKLGSSIRSTSAMRGAVYCSAIPSSELLSNTTVPIFQCLWKFRQVYEGRWMESYNTGYTVDTAAVAEDCTITVTDIFDVSGSVYGEFLDSGLNTADATGRSLLFSGS